MLCMNHFLFASLMAAFTFNSVAAESRNVIPLGPDSLSISSPAEHKLDVSEEGIARITYTNDKLKKGSLTITKSFDPPITINNTGFDLKPPGTETLLILWKFADGRTMQLTVENPGGVWHEHLIDVATLAADRRRDDLTNIASMSIRVEMLEESAPQTIELRNWWID